MTEENEKDLPGMGGSESEPSVTDELIKMGGKVVLDNDDVTAVALPFGGSRSEGLDMESVGEMLQGLLSGDMLSNFRQMEWADDEVERAQERHGETGKGPIYQAFPSLACISQPYMEPEIIFRAHCREILDRVAAGQDTRPGTDSEILGVLVDASLTIPLAPHLVCLYFRLVTKLFPPDLIEEFAVHVAEMDLESYERIHGERATDEQEHIRKHLTRERRGAGKGPEFENEV